MKGLSVCQIVTVTAFLLACTVRALLFDYACRPRNRFRPEYLLRTVRDHGGNISAQSLKPNGAAATIELPVKPEAECRKVETPLETTSTEWQRYAQLEFLVGSSPTKTGKEFKWAGRDR
jgi:hypothetical protein